MISCTGNSVTSDVPTRLVWIIRYVVVGFELLNVYQQENSQQSQYFTSSFLQITKYSTIVWGILCDVVCVLRLAVVIGCMPAVLIKEWERWDKQHNSENDHPSMYPLQNRLHFNLHFIAQEYSRLINCLYCLCHLMVELIWNILRYTLLSNAYCMSSNFWRTQIISWVL